MKSRYPLKGFRLCKLLPHGLMKPSYEITSRSIWCLVKTIFFSFVWLQHFFQPCLPVSVTALDCHIQKQKLPQCVLQTSYLKEFHLAKCPSPLSTSNTPDMGFEKGMTRGPLYTVCNHWMRVHQLTGPGSSPFPKYVTAYMVKKITMISWIWYNLKMITRLPF